MTLVVAGSRAWPATKPEMVALTKLSLEFRLPVLPRNENVTLVALNWSTSRVAFA